MAAVTLPPAFLLSQLAELRLGLIHPRALLARVPLAFAAHTHEMIAECTQADAALANRRLGDDAVAVRPEAVHIARVPLGFPQPGPDGKDKTEACIAVVVEDRVAGKNTGGLAHVHGRVAAAPEREYSAGLEGHGDGLGHAGCAVSMIAGQVDSIPGLVGSGWEEGLAAETPFAGGCDWRPVDNRITPWPTWPVLPKVTVGMSKVTVATHAGFETPF